MVARSYEEQAKRHRGYTPYDGGSTPRKQGIFLATPTKGCWGSSSLQYTAAEGGLLGRLTTLRLAEKVLGAWTLGSPLTDSLSRAQMSSYSAHLYFIV